MGGLRLSHIPQPFSQREVEILHLIKEGLSNRGIAQKLSLSVGTVKWYNKQIFSKLNVDSRTQAIEKAIEIGLIEPWVGQPGMGEAFPALASWSRHNLPASLNDFIGRNKERADLRTLLHSATVRLVTILGAGGVGKTRLALRVAEEALPAYQQGVWLVDLSLEVNADRVPQFVANSLGIRESGGLLYEDALARYLSHRTMLLVLDNCEHLADSCARLAAHLLTGCPNLRILATSREALEVEGEVFYPLSPLSFPDPRRLPELKLLRRYEAVQLFTERAGRVCPGFTLTVENGPAVARICQQLDGIPLALELAAARANLLSVEQIADRLENCFQLLAAAGRVVIPHHQTMKACLDWSYQLLSVPEQVLLRRLAVFAGGWELEAAEQVCSDRCIDHRSATPAAEAVWVDVILPAENILDLHSRLVNHSMVVVVTVPEFQPVQKFRYRLLEPIRQYAFEKLELAGEVEQRRDRHLAYFMSLAWRTSWKPFQKKRPDQGRQLKHDVDNLRSALGWALDGTSRERVMDGLRLAGYLESFWTQAMLYSEGRDWLAKALALSAGLKSPEMNPEDKKARALALEVCGSMEGIQEHVQEAKHLLDESVLLFREVGDDWHLSNALSDLAMSGFLVYAFPEEKMNAIEESLTLARRVGDPIQIANALQWRGHIKSAGGRHEEAFRDVQESLRMFLEAGDRGSACYPIVRLGYVARDQGDIAAALRYREAFIQYHSEIEDLSLDYYASVFLLVTSYYMEDYREMEEILHSVLDASLGQNQVTELGILCGLGTALKCQGEYRRAAAYFSRAMSFAPEENAERFLYMSISGLAGIAARLNQPVRAARLFGAVEKMIENISGPPDQIERREFAKDMAIVRDVLTADELSQAWAEGRSMEVEQVVGEGRAIAEELERS